jgi:kynureninase
MSTDPLLKWRDEFPVLAETTYLVSNSLGAMPRGVYDSLHEYADIWAKRGVLSWGDAWFDMNVEIGDLIAPIIGSPAGATTIHQNIAIGMSMLLSALDFSERNKVVIDGGIFPSDYYVLRAMVPDAEIVTPPGYDGVQVDVGAIVDAIDEQTRLVYVNHVLFRSCYIVDLQPIIEKAHSVGALVLANGYHATGIIPVDVTGLNIDFYISGVLKWMCGGPGGVFLYIRPDYHTTLEPALTGWFAHKRPFEFEVDDIDYRDDVYRFLNGTHGVPNLYAMRPGVEIIAQVGVDNIREKSMRQTRLLWQLAEAAGFKVNSPAEADKRGGTLTVKPPHDYEVSTELRTRNVVVDYRKGAGIRVSPHFYNTDDEVYFVIEQMQDILDSGAWEQHAKERRTFVT